MNGFSGTTDAGGMYVKALYDYQADDRTSLSFRTGDIIQVITQLESGWWDGVIHGVRGWFPSNYCAVVQRPSEEIEDDRDGADADDDTRSASGAEGDYSDDGSLSGGNDTILPIERNTGSANKEEEAAFWIPQATPDGRLFYFNTLTGVSTMELPLESPATNDSGPRNRTDVFIPEMSRPPAELLASGSGYNMEDTDDETSASDFEGPGTKGSYSSRVSIELLPFLPVPSALLTLSCSIDSDYLAGSHRPPQWSR
jgi:son of sevenless-like protein